MSNTERIVELAKDGMRCNEIARRVGVSRQRVSQVTKRAGIDMLANANRVPIADRLAVIDRIAERGGTFRDVKEALPNVKLYTLYDDVHLRRPQHRAQLMRKTLTPEQEALLIRARSLAKEGYDMASASRHLGVHREKLRRLLKGRGVVFRDGRFKN